LINISTTIRSLQLVGQNVKPKTEDIGSCRNWGFPKGNNSYLLNGNEGGCKTIGNGGFVVMSNHEGNQLSNFCLLPAGRRFYSLDNKQKINPEIKQDIEISYKQLFELDIYKSAYLSLKSKPGNMTLGTDKETLDGISIQ